MNVKGTQRFLFDIRCPIPGAFLHTFSLILICNCFSQEYYLTKKKNLFWFRFQEVGKSLEQTSQDALNSIPR